MFVKTEAHVDILILTETFCSSEVPRPDCMLYSVTMLIGKIDLGKLVAEYMLMSIIRLT